MLVRAVLLTIAIIAQPAVAQTSIPPTSCEAVVQSSDNGSGRFGVVAPGPDGRLAWSDGQPGQFLLRDGTGRSGTSGDKVQAPESSTSRAT